MSRIISAFVCLFLGASICYGQKILEERVSLHLNNADLRQALLDIEGQSAVRFAYDAGIADFAPPVTYSANNVKLSYALENILANRYTYRTAGSHVILLTKENHNKKESKTVIISGSVLDASSGQGIELVSVFDVSRQYASITDAEGQFSFELKNVSDVRGLNFTKRGYRDTVILLDAQKNTKLTVHLDFLPEYAFEIPQKPADYVLASEPYDAESFINMFLSEQVQANAANLVHIDNIVDFQFSVLPGLGSNFSKYGVVENRISVNLLAGYTKGIRGFEIGTLMNITKENVAGLQISGLLNIIGGRLRGSQIAGLINFTTQESAGTQIAGLANFSGDNFKGMQIASVLNRNKGHFEGVQISPAFNSSGSIEGVQVAGLLNYSKNYANAGRFALLGNYSKSGKSYGLQAALFFNRAYHQKGVQLALVNLNDTSEGFEAGFFSYVRRGYREHEITWDELNMLNYTFRTGNHRFYNSLHTAFTHEPLGTITFGYGLGTRVIDETRFYGSLEISYHFNIYNAFDTPTFYDYSRIGFYAVIPLPKQNFRLTVGHDINIHFAAGADNPARSYYNETSNLPVFSGETIDIRLGIKAGLRF